MIIAQDEELKRRVDDYVRAISFANGCPTCGYYGMNSSDVALAYYAIESYVRGVVDRARVPSR